MPCHKSFYTFLVITVVITSKMQQKIKLLLEPKMVYSMYMVLQGVLLSTVKSADVLYILKLQSTDYIFMKQVQRLKSFHTSFILL